MFDLHLVRPNWAVVTTPIPSTEDDDGDVCFESTGQAVRSGSNGEGFRAPASYISLECDGQRPKAFTLGSESNATRGTGIAGMGAQ